MNRTPFIGKRIELVSMDPHFDNISIALYRQGPDGDPAYRVHTYSQKPGAAERIAELIETMKTLGGLDSDASGLLRFPCGDPHEQAMKRLFLDACKLDPAAGDTPLPLTISDRKVGCDITATHRGAGMYQLTADSDEAGAARRITAINNGLIKLGELDAVDESDDCAAFPCRQAHDALFGVLLARAPNFRAAVREAEASASRGVLAAPSSMS